MNPPPVALAELIPPGPGHRTHYLWRILDCPHCHRQHTHGAGRDGTDAGHRVAHCATGQPNPGYILEPVGPRSDQDDASMESKTR